MNDKDYLLKAIELSNKSQLEGRFPAGALVVQNGEILSTEISSPYPDHRHADSKAVDMAFETKSQRLDGAVLYSSMLPCLMCISRAYWAGIRKIVFACSQKAVNQDYFETSESVDKISSKFNQKIQLLHIKELENEALLIVKEWEDRIKNG